MSADDTPEPADAARGAGGRGELLHPMEWAKRSGALTDVLGEMERELGRRRRRRRAAGAIAATVVLALAGTWWSTGPETPAPHPASSVLAQARPAYRELPDGSTVEVREGGKIRTDYSTQVRRVTLEAGEAHFQVAKNAARPFVVVIDDVEVRAVGTAFAVQRRAGELEVIVTEGRVRVTRLAAERAVLEKAESAPLAELDAGASLVVARAAGAVPRMRRAQLTAAQVASRLAWRVPWLDFSGTPLAEAVEEVGRHAGVKIVLADADLREVRLSGRLQADNVDTLLRLLEEEHGVRVTRRSGAEIVLHAGR